MANRRTSLLAYVIDTLTEEHAKILSEDMPEAVELVTAGQVREFVEDAIIAYERST